MPENNFIHEVPPNIEELKRKSNNRTSWRDRLEAVNELKGYDCRQSRDIITRLALHDPVFKVKEAAFRVAQMFGITKGGKPIYLGKKKKGNLVEGISKKLVRVRDSFEGEFSIDDFKQKFKVFYPEAFDIYEGDMGTRFDTWLKNVISALPKRK